MKKNWNNLTSEEKNLIVSQLNETYAFADNYDNAGDAAYNVRVGYEEDAEWFSFEVSDMDKFEEDIKGYIARYFKTYDVEFNDENNTSSKGWKASLEECKNYIEQYNGTNESYFADYKGGTVSIRCNESEEVIFETEVL